MKGADTMGMDMLTQMLGGGQNREQYQDFVKRYDQGAPWTGISDQEAADRYQQVASQLPPAMYQESAEAAFARLTPEQRRQFGQYLQQQARQQNVDIPDLNHDGIDDRLQDPGYLARATGQVQQQQPDILGSLLGGGGSGQGMLQSPIAKAALAGITAMAVKKMMAGR